MINEKMCTYIVSDYLVGCTTFIFHIFKTAFLSLGGLCYRVKKCNHLFFHSLLKVLYFPAEWFLDFCFCLKIVKVLCSEK